MLAASTHPEPRPVRVNMDALPPQCVRVSRSARRRGGCCRLGHGSMAERTARRRDARQPSTRTSRHRHCAPGWSMRRRCLLAPGRRSGELATARSRYVELERYAQQQRLLLDAARPRRARPGLAITPRARAARAVIRTIIGRHEQTLERLHERLADTAREIARLERAHDAYLDWRTEHARVLARGPAAAQVLQAREDRLLDELAVYPPAYLQVELGPPPANPEGRAAWRRGAQALECYRATYRIDDPYRTLADDVQGDATMGVRWWEKERDRVREEVGGVRQAITESLAHELDRGQALPGPGDRPGPINE